MSAEGTEFLRFSFSDKTNKETICGGEFTLHLLR
jgi:hypothetical protein